MHGFESKITLTHTHNLSSIPKLKRSPIKVRYGFIKSFSKLWSKL